MKVKICGITDLEAGLAAVNYGADAIGFVFADSKRKITPDCAKEIASKLPERIFKVGVFVNEEIEEIERIASFVGLTHIQLHGDESASFCESITLPVIKAFSIADSGDLHIAADYPCEFILLDGPKGKYRGGNGSTFDWLLFNPKLVRDKKIILAGGLAIENVADGIEVVQPDMVDVSSGVETDGKKDLGKIKRFIQTAKGNQTGRQENEHLYITE
jgi:phosphoribosylanthranilate isomerase